MDARSSKVLLATGVGLACLYIAMAPRSPLGGVLRRWAGSWADVLEGLVGVSAIVLVLAGYAGYLYSMRPRSFARYELLRLAVLLVWITLAEVVWEIWYGGEGLAEYLVSLLLASPVAIIMASYVEKKYKPPSHFIIIFSRRASGRDSKDRREH